MVRLDDSYLLSEKQIKFFRKNNFIKLKNVFDKATINHYNEVISKTVESIETTKVPLEDRDTYGKAFLQLFNLWQHNKDVRDFVFSKRLAKIASDLMGVTGVRLYHDQALFKEAGGGITPWHADQYYWPVESNKTITVWIPLQKTPLSMGPLEFSSRSHIIKKGRNLSISDDSEEIMDKKLRIKDFDHVIEPFDIGEVSFHSGWVFHRAGPNKTNKMRKVMTVIFIDHEMRLKSPENDGQKNDWKTWCPNVKIGEIIASPINPVLYSKGL